MNDDEVGLRRVHADHEIAFAQIHAVHAASGATHRAHFGFAEENGLAVVAGEENHLLAVGEFCADQLITGIEVDGNNAGRPRVREFSNGSFLHRAVARGQEDVAVSFFQVSRGNHGGKFFIFLEAYEIADRFSAGGGRGLWNFIDFQPVNAAFGSKQQNITVRRGDEEVFDEVIFAGFRANAAFAAARLVAINVNRSAFDVARMADGDSHFFVFNQIFELDFLDAVDNLSAALVAIGFHHFAELGDDDGFQFFLAGEDLTQFRDMFADLLQLAKNIVNRKTREAVQLQFEDGVDLRETQANNFGGQTVLLVAELNSGEALCFSVFRNGNGFVSENIVQVFAGVRAA